MIIVLLEIGTVADVCCYARQQILTKGDNNVFDDVTLYPPGQLFVNREEIVGLVKGFFRVLGGLQFGCGRIPC